MFFSFDRLPYRDINPFSSLTTLSNFFVISVSCVATMSVAAFSLTVERSTSVISLAVFLSSAPVGSSAMMSSGDLMIARAIATRYF